MAVTIDYSTGIISVPQADLTLVSGTLYELDTDQFRLELKSLEASENGMIFSDTHSHNTQVQVAGVTYARIVEILRSGNPSYSVQFTPDSQYSVRLAGSNNNIFDVENSILEQNQVQVIPTNAAGLIVTTTGSGLDAAQDTKLTEVHNELHSIEDGKHHSWMMRIFMAALGGRLYDAETTTVRIRDQADTKDRIVATVDENGNRSPTTLDGD